MNKVNEQIFCLSLHKLTKCHSYIDGKEKYLFQNCSND